MTDNEIMADHLTLVKENLRLKDRVHDLELRIWHYRYYEAIERGATSDQAREYADKIEEGEDD